MSFCSFFGGEVFQNHFEPGMLCDLLGGQGAERALQGGVAALERRWSPGTPEGQTHGGRVWVKGVPEEGGAWGPGK